MATRTPDLRTISRAKLIALIRATRAKAKAPLPLAAVALRAWSAGWLDGWLGWTGGNEGQGGW